MTNVAVTTGHSIYTKSKTIGDYEERKTERKTNCRKEMCMKGEERLIWAM
jgi:hypothetical protein